MAAFGHKQSASEYGHMLLGASDTTFSVSGDVLAAV